MPVDPHWSPGYRDSWPYASDKPRPKRSDVVVLASAVVLAALGLVLLAIRAFS